MWNCIGCNAQNNDKHDFCIECGRPKPKPSPNHCSNPNCNAYNEILTNPKQKYCGYCGSATTYQKPTDDYL